ncbi:sodium-dependent dicarboxylate transporter 2/3/5 [Nocardiopsis mwathae]|uniref:Sodium-dependent dicarboxylate transporter SdcS n=1 Tax=Nocardiopsis mwathae TaxID=1472723 RepID=A0A7W9YL23_9ACTN|nr:DASS family sodium-coupled anion symporter [Nocardiopsis mwathae]MBB6173955.1 sodium-dependent dicarboxylate transporter 2/3/5 [Nocardiopsis mwathae]
MSTSPAGSSGAPASAPEPEQEGAAFPAAKVVGLVAGPLLALLLFLALPDTLSAPGRITAGIAALMAVWWATEALPLPATALLPLVLFPVLLGADIRDVAAPYANDIIFLFMGGFMLALAMQRWNLHRRIALTVVAAVGTSPAMLIAGFMLATGFLTMWVSNTSTTIMMLPIGVAVVAMVSQLRGGRPDANFATALMLGIAYAASIGSVATLIGTPPNALMVGYLAETHGISVGFGQWMLVGLPLAAVFLVLAWVVLTKVVFPPRITALDDGRELIRSELRAMGPISRGELLVLLVFVSAALAWVGIPLLADGPMGGALPWLGEISDAGIAMTAAVLLFLIPAERRARVRLLDWETAVKLPWGILLLFGGGLSLSAQFGETGLSEWIGSAVGALSTVPVWVLVLAVAALVLLLTELTSNTATAATFLPVMGGVALGMGMDVMALVVPAVLASSLAFMLPVATPPNAIVFGSGHVTISQMLRGGVWLNVVALFLILATMYTLAGRMLGFTV